MVEVARFYWNLPNLGKKVAKIGWGLVGFGQDLTRSGQDFHWIWLDLARSYYNLAKVYVYDQLGQDIGVSSWRRKPMIDQWELRI